MAIDPIQLTKQLVNIESTTYHEAPAGHFLHEFLTNQRYAVEKMPVAQPDRATTPGSGTGERFNVYAAMPGVTPDVVLSTHMDTVPPTSRSRKTTSSSTAAAPATPRESSRLRLQPASDSTKLASKSVSSSS